MLKNKHLVALAAVAFLAAMVTPSFAVLEDGLRNYWDFDNNLEDWAPSYPGTASTVADNGIFDGANGTGGIGYGPGLFGGGGLEQNGESHHQDCACAGGSDRM